MVALKKHDNDYLINYLLKILELLKKPMLDEKDLVKLLNLFENE